MAHDGAERAGSQVAAPRAMTAVVLSSTFAAYSPRYRYHPWGKCIFYNRHAAIGRWKSGGREFELQSVVHRRYFRECRRSPASRDVVHLRAGGFRGAGTAPL